MSEETEVQDPVVQPEEKEEVSPLAEETTPRQESQGDGESEQNEEDKGPKTIPKERFDQVWARTKKAESRLAELDAERQREREERIRLEERIKAQEEKSTQQEWTWEQLDGFIAEGKITQAQAREYKEKALEARLEKKLAKQKETEYSNSRILSDIEQYKNNVPEIMVPGSDNRTKYERELRILIQSGLPDNYSTQFAAARAAFGDIETVKARNTTRTVVTKKEPFVETHTPSNQPKTPTKSFRDTLPKWKQEGIEKLIKGGVYKDWKHAEEVEKWSPKVVGRG